jgi:hypothetical protein
VLRQHLRLHCRHGRKGQCSVRDGVQLRATPHQPLPASFLCAILHLRWSREWDPGTPSFPVLSRRVAIALRKSIVCPPPPGLLKRNPVLSLRPRRHATHAGACKPEQKKQSASRKPTSEVSLTGAHSPRRPDLRSRAAYHIRSTELTCTDGAGSNVPPHDDGQGRSSKAGQTC